MPFKHTESKIPRHKDKRVKLSLSDKFEICELYGAGCYSQRELASLYSVSRRLIVFTIYPERREANYKTRVANGGSKQYYNKEKHTVAMRLHRQHKQKLYLSGELVSNE